MLYGNCGPAPALACFSKKKATRFCVTCSFFPPSCFQANSLNNLLLRIFPALFFKTQICAETQECVFGSKRLSVCLLSQKLRHIDRQTKDILIFLCIDTRLAFCFISQNRHFYANFLHLPHLVRHQPSMRHRSNIFPILSNPAIRHAPSLNAERAGSLSA